jgi:hypothetical protein
MTEWRTLRLLAVALTLAVAVLGAGGASAGAAPAHPAHPAHPHAPVAVDAATIQLSATRSAPPVVTVCAGPSRVIEIRTDLAGQAASADPRLTGALTVHARVLLATTGGVGYTTGTVVIRDPATGRVKVRAALTQLETENATSFNGLLVGTVEPGHAHLVALYSGRIDPQPGTLHANVGTDGPAAPHDSAVVASGSCLPPADTTG